MATPVGEDSWLAYVDETIRNASDIEKRVNAIEVLKRAVEAEPGSLRLWLSYCNYFWSLWSDSQSAESDWPEDERMLGREVFTRDEALSLWQRGYEAIQYRISDSHQLWDRWVSLEMDLLSTSRTPEGIMRITHLYRNRLATPHLSWDETSQAFSSFLTEYNRDVWEQSMKEITSNAQETKRLIDARDPFEIKLRQAVRADDVETQKARMIEYLKWEMVQSKRDKKNAETCINLCQGLYHRALTGLFATDENAWQEYVIYMSSSHSEPHAASYLLDVVRRAVQHCPWSGQLWNRYILCAEEARLDFAEIEAIKHAATSEDQLYKTGMESMIEMYVAWCGFLKRTAMDAGAGDEAVDVADVGLRAALEDVAVVGKRLYGKDFQGDPKFRLERIYIQYLTEKKGAIEEARAQWNRLASTQVHADSHDFWFRYYMWEMLIFSSQPNTLRSPTPSSGAPGLRVPALATSVLSRAVARHKIDWPEKVLEVYLQHCNDYEPPGTVRMATDRVHKAVRELNKRREAEHRAKEEEYAAYYAHQAAQAEQNPVEAQTTSESKRKREESQPDVDAAPESASKRQKSDNQPAEAQTNHVDAQEQKEAKRDRENTTIIVDNLPGDVTQSKVRQYFKEYGHVNNITAFVRDEKAQTATALIEFKTPEEAQSALLRDGKYLDQSQLKVASGFNLTVYVTNFPPTADEKYIRGIFKDCGDILSMRWPSLKVNTHRRFCYISFRDSAAAAAATGKDGKMLEGKFRLLAKFSDPGHKKNREGALAEGREVRISNLDKSTPEAELREVFEKYGKVTRVNVPLTMGGKNRGFAFVDYENKDQAEKAVAELDSTKLRTQILKVELSKESKIKPSAKTNFVDRQSASPAPGSAKDEEGDEAMADAEQSKLSETDISSRTIALMGLPDTVNDARVHALVESIGAVTKLILRPSNGGARIEFADAAMAGKAAMKLDGIDFEGGKLRIGSLEELRHAKAANTQTSQGPKDQKPKAASGSGPKHIMPPPSVRRPMLQKGGPKRGIGFAGARKPTGESKDSEANRAPNGKPAPKSNADFKAMFLAGGKEKGKSEREGEHKEGENGV